MLTRPSEGAVKCVLRFWVPCPDYTCRRLDHRHGHDLVHILHFYAEEYRCVHWIWPHYSCIRRQVVLVGIPYRRWKRILVAYLRAVPLGVTSFA